MSKSKRLENHEEREARARAERAQLYRESIIGLIENLTEPNELEYFYYFIRAKLRMPEEVSADVH